MKKRVFYLISVVAVLLSASSALLPSMAAAFGKDIYESGKNAIQVTLTGTSDPTAYSLKATHVVDHKDVDVAMHYDSGKKAFISDAITSVGGDCVGAPEVISNLQAMNRFKITATANGGIAGTDSIDMCGQGQGYIFTTSIKVTAPTATQKPGSFSGTLTYKDEDGSVKPYTSNTQATLKGGPDNKTYNVRVDDNGNITPINDLLPGTYTFTADYTPPGGKNQHRSEKITITAGKPTTLKSAAVTSANDSNSDVSPTCEAGSNPLNWMLCPVFNMVADASDWLFAQVVQPMLRTTPINTDPSDPSYQAWSNFRIYGNVFLVIALLVVVFGQSIGGGIIDAYTAKKVLPRLLIAVILINLSIYIVALLVDITNIVGGSLGSVMTAPLQGAGAFVIHPSGIQSGSIVIGGAAFASIAALLSGIFFALSPAIALSFFGHAAAFIAIFVVMPVFLGLLAAFLTLVIRQALILALVLVSPVAFALYCLPNTEQYFRRWWSFLLQTLMVYPIVIVFFAVSDILSVTVMSTGNNHQVIAGSLAAIVSFCLQFLPLLFIPYSFRLAGGLLGRAHELMTNFHKRGQEAIKGNANDPNSLRNRVKGNLGADFARARAAQYRGLRDFSNDTPAGASRRRRILGGAASRLAYGSTIIGDPMMREAQLIEEGKRRIQQIKDNGDDSIINARASFIDPTDGKRKTLDGKEVSETDYKTAKRIHPRLAELQAVAEYRAGKVNTTEEAEEFTRNFGLMAQQEGLNVDEANGMFIGLAFGKQAERGELKYGRYTQGANGTYQFSAVGDQGSFVDSSGDLDKTRAAGFVKEQYAKRGSYEGGRMLSSYFQSMGDIKKHHLDQLGTIEAKESQGQQLTAQEQAQKEHSRGQLKQILEIQKSFEYGGQVRDPDTGEVKSVGGLSGASAETAAAFNKMKGLDLEIGAAPPPVPVTDPKTGKTVLKESPHPTRQIVNELNGEIEAGRTYESEHSRGHGNSRP